MYLVLFISAHDATVICHHNSVFSLQLETRNYISAVTSHQCLLLLINFEPMSM